MMRRALLIPAAILGACAASAHAQSLRDQCAEWQSAECEALVNASLTLQPRVAIAAAGGNATPGTASTLGMRVPGSPRWSTAVRGTLARASVPPFGNSDVSPTLWSVNADASVGLFNGVRLAPTIGGFGSIDVLASIGLLSVPEDDGFETSSPLTWALGAQVGVLRESFTAPGVSLSAMYRSLPDIRFGQAMELSEQHVVSVRGTVGKRVLGIGLTGGMAWDRGASDVRVRFFGPLPAMVILTAEEQDVTFNRVSFFGNVSYTLLILNMAAELGWQQSGDRPARAHDDTGKGGLFGGVALRLAI